VYSQIFQQKAYKSIKLFGQPRKYGYLALMLSHIKGQTPAVRSKSLCWRWY